MKNIKKVEIEVKLESGEKFDFSVKPCEEKVCKMKTIEMIIGGEEIPFVNIKSINPGEYVESVAYRFILDMKNYSKVIAPDSGRWYLRHTSLIDFWKNCREFTSDISDVKMPLFIFLNESGNAETAVGVIGRNWETEFSIIEPESNRALNVHTGQIVLQIKKGTKDYSLHTRELEEYLYLFSAKESKRIPWMLIQRHFSDVLRKQYDLKDIYNENAFEPIWCSWVDWDSKEINTKMLLESMEEGVKTGIKNFIIDDGWYGHGLDSDYSTEMNIGDWEPDKNKIPDMHQLVEKAHKMGARTIIWCAPHAVAKYSKAYKQNYKLLLADEGGKPVMNEPQYHSYCFCCPESRKEMVDICVKLFKNWNFDGAKYDLFNWIPNYKCKSPYHTHDTESAIEGLEMTLEEIWKRTTEIKPSNIIELKQNYGTPFFSQYGSLMRAGDAPFDGETNFQRMIHIQSYTPYALNDYQTFTKQDSEIDVAVAIIKMLAVGIPAYGVNFKKLSEDVKKVIKHYNEFFHINKRVLKEPRVPLNANNTVIKIDSDNVNYIFVLLEQEVIQVSERCVIFNGTYSEYLTINCHNKEWCNVQIFDCKGNKMGNLTIEKGLSQIECPCGGRVFVEK